MAFPIASRVNFIDRLNSFRERFGIKGAIYKSIDVVLHKVLRSYIHTVVWLDLEPVAKMACLDPRFTFRFLTADEVATFAKDQSYFIDPSLVDGVREGREVCFAALEGDRLGCLRLLHVGICSARTSGWCRHVVSGRRGVYVVRFHASRLPGARLHGYIMGLALQELAKRGITKLVSIVAWTNWASLKSCWRLGYINLGNMLTIGGKKRAIGLYPAAAKKLGVRFGRNAVKSASKGN